MNRDNRFASVTERGLRVALCFAIAAEALSAHYEHGQWLTPAQGAQLAAEWLRRSQRTLRVDERRHLAEVAGLMARQIAATLSREAGLYTAHEMMEALDPNYHSEIAGALLIECERLLDVAENEAASGRDA